MADDESRLTLKAHAKINLALEVLDKRPDGYHEVSMIMQSVSLHDTVTLSLQAANITLSCDRSELLCDNSNLAFRAADLLRREYGIARGVQIELTKRIPLAAGLAGGSTDAAAVLKGLNRLWNMDLPAAELERLAARLGSDVPFCLQGGTSLATGRGEILTALPDFSGYGVVLANPPLAVSTAWVYGNYRSAVGNRRRDVSTLRRSIEQQDFPAVAAALFNDLESVTVPAYPPITALKEQLLQAGAAGVLMSGSGPTVFALTPDPASAGKLAGQAALGSDVAVFIAETVAREEM